MKFFLLITALVSSIQIGFAADCSRIWANGFPDVRPTNTPVICDEFFPLNTSMTSDQRLFTVSSLTSKPQIKDEMEIIAEALSYSSTKYAAYGRVPSITIIRQDTSHPNSGGLNAMAFTYVQFFNTDRESCPIFVYPSSEVLGKDHLQQLIAREVFHCVQKVNFKDQVSYASTDNTQSYWFEGLAQLFSNFVYPSNDFEYTTRFPAPDQKRPFFDQENAYSSENFWQSYSNLITDSTFFTLMDLMPTAPGEASATTVLSLPRFSEALHKYAQQITLKQVRDSSGAVSPYVMSFEQKILQDTNRQEIRLAHNDMTVGAYEIKIPKGGKWTLRFTSPDKTKISMKKPEDLAYTVVDRPVVVTSECSSERTIQVILTTASDSLNANTTVLSVAKEINPACECLGAEAPPQIDQCLIGTWNIDHSSIEQFWRRTNQNPMVQFKESVGEFSVNFNKENIGTWSSSSWSISASGDVGEGMSLNVERITNGVSRFRYSANGTKSCSKQVSSTLSGKTIMSMNGQVISTNDEPPMDMSTGVFTYSCNERQFIFKEFTINGNTMLMDYVFNRQ